jgi:triacylglycerol esterase/lipase EstA (alpha/beta hydrolase family)
MTYVAKPVYANNKGLKEFSSAEAAVKYLDSWGVPAHGTTLAEKVQELGWVEKLTVK